MSEMCGDTPWRTFHQCGAHPFCGCGQPPADDPAQLTIDNVLGEGA